MAGLLPGLVSCVAVPYTVYRMLTPEIQRTPGASQYAREQLIEMGPMGRAERIVLFTLCGEILAWMSSQLTGLEATMCGEDSYCPGNTAQTGRPVRTFAREL